MRSLFMAVPLLVAGIQFTAMADTIAPGTEIVIRTDGPIMVHDWDRGRIYTARVDRDVIARDGDVAIPRGANAELIVRQVGPNEMALDLESIMVNGRRYVMDTTGGPEARTRRDDDRDRDRDRDNGGLVGAIIGAVTGEQGDARYRGGEIRIPANVPLRFQLRSPLHTVGWQDPGYNREQNHYHRDNDWYR